MDPVKSEAALVQSPHQRCVPAGNERRIPVGSYTLTTMSIDDALRELGEGLHLKLTDIAQRIEERSLESVPEYYRNLDPALFDLGRQTTVASLRAIFDGLSNGRNPPQHELATALEEARLAAQANVDLQNLIRTHRVAQAATWQEILEETERLCKEADVRLAVLKLASRYHFEWNDRVTSEMVRAYEQERELLFRDRERRKRDLVRDILDGMPVDTSLVTHNLRGMQLAVIGWGLAPHKTVQSWAESLGCSVLSVPGTGDAVFAWFEGDSDRLAAVISRSLTPPPDTYVAVGTPAPGIEGFRMSHRQALEAYRVARVKARPVTTYRDVALEALVVHELQAARDFVAYELGPISGNDHRDSVLRETLRAYFQTGQNASSAAHVLGVHERTVAYRLRSVEERIGAPVGSRRDELSVALRLLDLLEASSRSLKEGFETPEGALAGTQ